MSLNDNVVGETFEVRYIWGKRRRYPRYPLIVPVRIAFGDLLHARTELGISRDIGLGGMGVVCPASAEMREHELVSVQLAAHQIDERLIITGVVVYSDGESGFGLQFPEFTSRTRIRLKQLLTRLAV